MLLTAVLTPAPEGGFTALNRKPEQRHRANPWKRPLENLREATELYLEEFPLATTGQPLVMTFQVERRA